MSGFHPRSHFDSGQVSKCFRCERLGENSWPAAWLLMNDGFMCPWCAFPDAEWLPPAPANVGRTSPDFATKPEPSRVSPRTDGQQE